ncbi:MAG TPA: squalene/phytoene synthase family protein [Gammaproteobacteria bacterium]|nr:squalene/phytoene synthase family protein [Gammaproteobacteria bacterium]
MSPEEYCENLLQQYEPDTRLALLFTDAPRRRPAAALFALNRELHRSVSEPSDAGVARARLQWWADEIRNCVAGQASHPVTRGLSPALERFGLAPESLLELASGAEAELEHAGLESRADLDEHCYRNGGLLWLAAAQIFGYRDRGTLQAAQNLGNGARLVEILRDAATDAARGRIYLPGELLRRHAVSADDLSRPDRSDSLAEVLRELHGLARERFRRARELLPADDRPSQRGLLILAAFRERTLEHLARRGFPLDAGHGPGPGRRLWIAWRTARRAARGRAPRPD